MPTFKVALKCPCLHLPWAHWGQRFTVLAKAVGGRNVHFEGTFLENLPAAPETRFNSWIREDSLEEGMVTHSSILAWRIP